MPRNTHNRDYKGRARRFTTELEIRQAEEIDRLQSELRSLRASLRKRARGTDKSRPRSQRSPLKIPFGDYNAFLDGVWIKLEKLRAKGRDLYGTCDACGNIDLPHLLPLIEGEKMDYADGNVDALVFPPFLAAGGVKPPLRESMMEAARLARALPE